MNDGILNEQFDINRKCLIQIRFCAIKVPVKNQFRFDSLKQKYAFGGSLLKKARNRHARPIATREPMHFILKSSKAVGRNSFGHSRNLRAVNTLVGNRCAKYGVKLISYSNNFNHLHMLLRFPSRAIYLRFVKSITAALSMLITGAKKNARGAQKFFDERPFTRIVRGFKAYKIVWDYIRLNQLEAAGVIPYQRARLKNLSELERAFF